MDLFGPGRPAMVIILFFLIIFRLGIVTAVVDRPIWNEEQWKTELQIYMQRHNMNLGQGIPELVRCALNIPRKTETEGCDDTIRELLLNEVLLRNKLFKTYKEDCNSTGTKESELVVNPPKRGDGLNYPKYLIWQEKVINSKVQLCDPHQFLRCSTEKKCICLSGSVRVGDFCVYPHSSPCRPYYTNKGFFPFGGQGTSPNIPAIENDPKLYFNPFVLCCGGSRYVLVVGPRCLDYFADCIIENFHATYHREQSYCIETIDPKDGRGVAESKRSRYFVVRRYLENLLPLPFNEECNSQDHNRLFTSTKEEDGDYEVRLKTVEDIMTRGTMFCDLEKFLTCGPSEKCECMAPSLRKGDKCVLPDQLDKCQIDPTMEPILMNKSLVSRAREKLMIGLVSAVTVAACEGKLTCQTDMMEIYCTCPPGKTGQECEETLTKFLSIVRVPSLPTDVLGYPEKVKIFSQFNNKTVEFERIFKLGEAAVCNWETQNEAEILVGRIRKLMHRGTTMTRAQYEDLSNKIQNFTTANQNKGVICNETLTCKYSTKKCVRQARRSYLEDLVNELEKFKTRKCAQLGCSKFPKDFDDVMFGEEETLFYGGEHEMEYHRIVQELSKLLKTCDCQSKNEGVDIMRMTQSLENFILLISVAVLFVICIY